MCDVLLALWMTSCLHIMASNMRCKNGMYSVTPQWTVWILTTAYTQTDPPGGSTGPEADSDICDCLVMNGA